MSEEERERRRRERERRERERELLADLAPDPDDEGGDDGRPHVDIRA